MSNLEAQKRIVVTGGGIVGPLGVRSRGSLEEIAGRAFWYPQPARRHY